MAFSLDEEYRSYAREYLGYFNLENRYILSSGQPIVIGQQQILETNMRNILDQYSLNRVIAMIDKITESRCKIDKAKDRLKVSEIAYSVKMNPKEIAKLWREDYKLCERLAHVLAVPLYWHPTGRGINPGMSGGNIPIVGD